MRPITVKTNAREELLDITASIAQAVEESGVQSGLCNVFSMHTTAAVTVNENADPDVKADILVSLRRIVQDGLHYFHQEGNSPAHIKSSLIGPSITIPISGGRLVLGSWQGIMFCEFDGPRTRRVGVTIIKSD